MTADKELSCRVSWSSFLAGMVLIILLTAVFCQAADKVGRVIALQGKVEIKREMEATFHRAQVSEDVYERDLVKTGPASKVKIFFEDESLLYLAENSQIQVREFDYKPVEKFRRSLLKALSGKVRFLVSKLMPADNSRFEVETDTAIMEIRGTDGIAVMKNPTQAICLSGEIYVHGLGLTKEVILTPYMMTIVEPGQDPVSPFPVDMDYLQQLLGDFRIRVFSLGGEPAGMTGTIEAWSITPPAPGVGGPANMTETIQSWTIGPSEEIPVGPPVLLEPPAGMQPSPSAPPSRETHVGPSYPPRDDYYDGLE